MVLPRVGPETWVSSRKATACRALGPGRTARKCGSSPGSRVTCWEARRQGSGLAPHNHRRTQPLRAREGAQRGCSRPSQGPEWKGVQTQPQNQPSPPHGSATPPRPVAAARHRGGVTGTCLGTVPRSRSRVKDLSATSLLGGDPSKHWSEMRTRNKEETEADTGDLTSRLPLWAAERAPLGNGGRARLLMHPRGSELWLIHQLPSIVG